MTGPSLERSQVWDASDVSAYLKIPRQSVMHYARVGKLPVAARIGRHVLFSKRAIIELIEGEADDE
jgi:hypothetical protein